MKRRTTLTGLSIVVFLYLGIAACNSRSGERLYGTWQGKTRINEDIAITLRPDSTIEIETQEDSVRQILKGTFQLVDRRLRIALTARDTYIGNIVKRETKNDQDEALVTFTSADEMVLRKGTEAIVLQRAR